MPLQKKLTDQSREELLDTVQRVTVEAEALSSRIVVVSEIGIAINSTLDMDNIFQVITKKAKWLLDFVHCSICLQDDNGNWVLTVLIGDQDYQLDSDDIQQSEIGDAIKYGQSRLIKDDTTTHFLPDIPSKLIIPLNSEDEVIGTINFACNRITYKHEDMRIAYLLALQLASAIRNARRMTQLREARQQLEVYARELEMQNQELDAYSHTIAHDLKSPLSVIPMKAGLVKMYASLLPPKAIEHLDDITDRTKHMAEMIDQLLTLSTIRDADTVLECVETNDVLRRALLRFPEVEMGHVEIMMQSDLPSVSGHSQWIEEVFANLISNAIKYMGEDNANPKICIKSQVESNEAIFAVIDNGIGIRPEDQERLFHKFTRLHDVEAEGVGLGLSIVQRIIRKLDGRLGVKSTWGKGTTFWFSVPLAVTEDECQITAD